MTHAEFVRQEAERMRRMCGALDETMENVALIGLLCSADHGDAYRKQVGASPPATFDRDVVADFWCHATKP